MQGLSSNRLSVRVTSPNSNPEVAASEEKELSTLHDIFEYLETVMDPESILLFRTHVLRHRNTHRAFATIVQARLVQSLCDDIGVKYRSGNNPSSKFDTPHGQRVSVVDIVRFFASKTPPDGDNGKGSSILPSTFANHRSWHLRANTCLIQLAGRNITDESLKQSLDLVKKLLLTALSELHTLEPGEHGSWDEFKKRVVLLEKFARG